jgi:hypothetical protein
VVEVEVSAMVGVEVSAVVEVEVSAVVGVSMAAEEEAVSMGAAEEGAVRVRVGWIARTSAVAEEQSGIASP